MAFLSKPDSTGEQFKHVAARPTMAVSRSTRFLAQNPISELLSSTCLRAIVPVHEIIAVSDTETIGACVRTLSQYNIHSVPVLHEGTCVGFVDALDVCRHIAAASPDPARATKDDIAKFAADVVQTPLSELIESRPSSNFFAINETDSAGVAVDILSQGVHRAALYAETKPSATDSKSPTSASAHFAGVCSQSDIIRYTYAATKGATGALEKMLKRSIHSFVGQGLHLQSRWLSSEVLAEGKKLEIAGMPGFQVMCINQAATVLAAVQNMALAHCRRLAVIDSAGNLTGNISVADLKHCFDAKVPCCIWSLTATTCRAWRIPRLRCYLCPFLIICCGITLTP
jgi:CBS domain-containing protein